MQHKMFSSISGCYSLDVSYTCGDNQQCLCVSHYYTRLLLPSPSDLPGLQCALFDSDIG